MHWPGGLQIRTGGPREGKGGAVRASKTAAGSRCTMCPQASGMCATEASEGGGRAGLAWAHKGQSMLVRSSGEPSSPAITTFITPMLEQTTSSVLGESAAASADTPSTSR